MAFDTSPDGMAAARSADLDPFDDKDPVPIGVLRLEPVGDVLADLAG